jgi:hypothetical protein
MILGRITDPVGGTAPSAAAGGLARPDNGFAARAAGAKNLLLRHRAGQLSRQQRESLERDGYLMVPRCWVRRPHPKWRAASRAPQAEIRRLKERHGWDHIPWYTITDDFDKDFDVDEWHGTNAFIREGDRIFRTYFINNRGDEQMGNTCRDTAKS